MARRGDVKSHGVFRVIVKVVDTESGNVRREYSEGPYSTLSAAKGRMTTAKRELDWWRRSRGKHRVELELQGIEPEAWETITKETLQ